MSQFRHFEYIFLDAAVILQARPSKMIFSLMCDITPTSTYQVSNFETAPSGPTEKCFGKMWRILCALRPTCDCTTGTGSFLSQVYTSGLFSGFSLCSVKRYFIDIMQTRCDCERPTGKLVCGLHIF
jgi:hypothetical protein